MTFSPTFSRDEASAGLYIHVPFCVARCSYCGFVSNIHGSELKALYLRSVAKEIELRARDCVASGSSLECDTIYFGGGTPSLLLPEEIDALIHVCREYFAISDCAEITMEMNPGTIDLRVLSGFRSVGVNRASLGIQSFVDTELVAMGRLHDSAQAISAYLDMRRAGFDNVSIDLIAGFPGQTVDSVCHSLKLILGLRPEHLSAYLLEVKDGTRLAEMIESKQFSTPDDDVVADMYDAICVMTLQAGYEHYEISNFALPGRFSGHNMKYWTDRVYLGFGPGAHGMTGHQRYANLEDLDLYERALSNGSLPVLMVSEIVPEVRFKDAMIMGLRLVNGIDMDIMSDCYGVDVKDFVLQTIGDLQPAGLCEIKGNMLSLTPRGRLLSNVVFSRWV